MSGQLQQGTLQIRLTGRGAVVVMLVVFALGLTGAAWLGSPVLAGAFFIAGSAAAVFYVRQRDLLVATIAPPLVFGIALVGVKAGTASGSIALSIAEGAAITLAGVAPWLFAGTALSLIIAWQRGLRGCLRELRNDRRPAGRRPGPVDGSSSGLDAQNAQNAQDAQNAQEEPAAPTAPRGSPQSGPAA
jgi:hypothetical protein